MIAAPGRHECSYVLPWMRVKPQDGMQYYFAGGEYTFMKMLAVRGRIQVQLLPAWMTAAAVSAPAVKTTVGGFTRAPASRLRLGDYAIHLDYAYTKMDLVDAVHRFTLCDRHEVIRGLHAGSVPLGRASHTSGPLLSG